MNEKATSVTRIQLTHIYIHTYTYTHTQIQVQGRRFHLGFFANPQDAALSYDAAGRRHHGSRAKCNFDEEGKRTKVRINLKNSAFAKAKYTMLSPGGGETGTTGTTGK